MTTALNQLQRFLELAHEKWPTDGTKYHNMTLNEYAIGTLFSFWDGDKWVHYPLEGNDLESPEVTIEKIASNLAEWNKESCAA